MLCIKVKSSIESQKCVWWKISSGHDNKMGAKDDGGCEDLQNSNLSVCESKKGEKLMG